MSLHYYAENNDGEIQEWPDLQLAEGVEMTIMAAEMGVASSTIILHDPNADFYIRGLKPMYFVETDAEDDAWFGIIGPFFAEERTVSRGVSLRTDVARLWTISVGDVNTLATRRLQKGTDSERPEETDIPRMQWLVGTAEVIGGGGDHGFTIEDTDFLFTDGASYPMSKTSYWGQDTAGVVNDCLQDSGKNAYLFNSPLVDEAIRVGIWYGHTARSDYASIHKISNVLEDISADVLDAWRTNDPDVDTPYVFPPSFDAALERSPSRLVSGAMVTPDNGPPVYVSRPATAEAFERRDMSFAAELVKTQAQAIRRATRYTERLKNEDDAIETAVIVPAKLVHAWVPGHRVQFKAEHLPGYSSYVWMRVAKVTYRLIQSSPNFYELGLDLRAEEPPDSDDTGTGVEPCDDLTPAGTYYPLGGTDDTPNASDGVVYYYNPGEPRPIEPETMLGEVGHWHFPVYGAGGIGSIDYAGGCTQSQLRLMVRGDGTMTINVTQGLSGNTFRAILYHHRYEEGQEGNPLSGVDVIDQSWASQAPGTPFEVDISTHGGANCTHWVDIKDDGGVCNSGIGFVSMVWDPA